MKFHSVWVLSLYLFSNLEVGFFGKIPLRFCALDVMSGPARGQSCFDLIGGMDSMHMLSAPDIDYLVVSVNIV